MIETDFARFSGIESTVSIEDSTRNDQPQALHAFESMLEVGFEIERTTMVTGNDPGGSDNIAVSVRDRQDIAGLGAFTGLISHAFTAPLGNCVTAIQVQLP
jgi:hypothetical protein